MFPMEEVSSRSCSTIFNEAPQEREKSKFTGYVPPINSHTKEDVFEDLKGESSVVTETYAKQKCQTEQTDHRKANLL